MKATVLGLLISVAFAGLAASEDCTVEGIEGFYYLAEPLPLMESRLCIALAPWRASPTGLVGHLMVPASDSLGSRDVLQVPVDNPQLKGCDLEFTATLEGHRIAFIGRFLLPEPFLHAYPHDAVVLKGVFCITEGDGSQTEYERSLRYDPGY